MIMGFTINKEIVVKLSWEDATLIGVALFIYGDLFKESKNADKGVMERAVALQNRLGGYVYAYPNNDFSGRPATDERVEALVNMLSEVRDKMDRTEEDPKPSERSVLEMWEEVGALLAKHETPCLLNEERQEAQCGQDMLDSDDFEKILTRYKGGWGDAQITDIKLFIRQYFSPFK